VEFTFDAFRETIDALGGVEFDVPQNMNYDDPQQGLSIHLKKGYQLLDGDKAEQLVRFRNYPMGDIDRTKVQFDFLYSFGGVYKKEILSMGGRIYKIPFITEKGTFAYTKAV
jgi:LCP family protein required for cell wall assembly